VFIILKDKLSHYWRHAFLTAKSGPELGGVINPDTGVSIKNPEAGRHTRMDFDQLKISEKHRHLQRAGCLTDGQWSTTPSRG
jgi:hypothetical protein